MASDMDSGQVVRYNISLIHFWLNNKYTDRTDTNIKLPDSALGFSPYSQFYIDFSKGSVLKEISFRLVSIRLGSHAPVASLPRYVRYKAETALTCECVLQDDFCFTLLA